MAEPRAPTPKAIAPFLSQWKVLPPVRDPNVSMFLKGGLLPKQCLGPALLTRSPSIWNDSRILPGFSTSSDHIQKDIIIKAISIDVGESDV